MAGTYGRDELNAAIARMVRWRWPGERLLLVVPCEAEWALMGPGWELPGEPDQRAEPEHGSEPGALGVTDARIVFHGFERPGRLLRSPSWLLGSAAVAGAMGGDLTVAVWAGGLAFLTRAAARGLEVLGLGSGSVELAHIEYVDRARARVQGIDRWGITYRLHVEPATFDRVAELLPAP